MKYVLVYLLSGKAKKYNERLMKETADVSGERYIVDVSRLPPHITLKSPFEFDDFKALDKFLKQFVKKRKKTDILVNSFGSFRRFVSFMKTDFSSAAEKIQKELVMELRRELEIKLHEFDIKYKPHATICYGNSKETFNIIWNYLRTKKKPGFNLDFDNIALLRKPNDKWEIYKKYKLR